ncbi:hypothetical protein JCM1393_08050 [Clostridium carnis]
MKVKYRKIKILLIIMISIIISGCGLDLKNKENGEVENINYKDYTYKEGQSLNNAIFIVPDRFNSNRDNISDINTRNDDIANNYLITLEKVKEFSKENSLKLKYIQSLEDVKALSSEENRELLINKLNGAESTHFFTEEEGFNIDLSINSTNLTNNIENEEWIFADILFKSSIENIDKDFKFKDSKLDEFRKYIIGENNNLDYNVINEYVEGYFNGKYDKHIKFYNKIDDNTSEVIRIEDNNIYYKITYDPKY